MKPFAVLSVTLVLLVAGGVHGGIRKIRQTSGGSGWGSGSGWGPAGTNIAEQGASSAIGVGGAIAEHGAVVAITGNQDVPGQFAFYTGSDTGLQNSVYNSQQSYIASDGSSEAYQGNSASNSGYASDYLGGDAQGITVDVASSGWSAVEGEGAVGQVDALEHTGGPAPAGWAPPAPAPSGWKKPY